METVTIPASVTGIGEYAFHDCDKLTKVTILNPDCCPIDGKHDWKMVYHKATFTDYGYQTMECTKCAAAMAWIAIGGMPVTTAKLAKTSFVYTGKPIKPEVILANYDGTLSKEYYSLSYLNNTNAGTAKVTYSPDKKAKKAGIRVSKWEVVTIPKKCKKGKYKIAVKAAETKKYLAGNKTVTINI